MEYVITSTDGEEKLYWCNDDGHGWAGWGGLGTASIYSEYEKPLYGLPYNGDYPVSWEPLPNIVCPKCNQEFSGTNESEITTIADHGYCYDCKSEWQLEDHDLHGELDTDD